jgi:N-glycosidase YbiA
MKIKFSIITFLILFFSSFDLSANQTKGKNTIYFYEKKDPYYELTNFYENWQKDGLHPVIYKNQKWKTSEHAFQAEKFNYKSKHAQKVRQKILKASTSREAFDIAQRKQSLMRKDWHQVKDRVMLEILRSKFSDPHLSNVLHKTGKRNLVEASPYDAYWGYGKNGKGENRLGQLIMKVRKEKFGF